MKRYNHPFEKAFDTSFVEAKELEGSGET